MKTRPPGAGKGWWSRAIWMVGNSVVPSMPVFTSGETRTWTSWFGACWAGRLRAKRRTVTAAKKRMPTSVQRTAAKGYSGNWLGTGAQKTEERTLLRKWVAVAGLTMGLAAWAAPAQTLSDGSGAYATRKYRNLFKDDGHSEKEIRAKIDAAYQQLFHGDPQ